MQEVTVLNGKIYNHNKDPFYTQFSIAEQKKMGKYRVIILLFKLFRE